MKIHFLTSAHNSLSQRLLVELTERGHKVTWAIASSEEAMVKSVKDQAPDLVICSHAQGQGSTSDLVQACLSHRSPGNFGRSRAILARLGDRDGRKDMGR